MEKEISRLQVIIRDADSERKRQQKELDQVVTERDILGTQLVRRNDELALLYEKIKLQQATMNKGELQYRHRMEDLRVLKLEIKKLQREKVILNKSVSSVEELRREIFHTQVSQGVNLQMYLEVLINCTWKTNVYNFVLAWDFSLGTSHHIVV